MGFETGLKVIGTVTIEVGTMTDDGSRVARRRHEELTSWLLRHREDIEAVVCSTFDALKIRVSIENMEEAEDDN